MHLIRALAGLNGKGRLTRLGGDNCYFSLACEYAVFI